MNWTQECGPQRRDQNRKTKKKQKQKMNRSKLDWTERPDKSVLQFTIQQDPFKSNWNNIFFIIICAWCLFHAFRRLPRTNSIMIGTHCLFSSSFYYYFHLVMIENHNQIENLLFPSDDECFFHLLLINDIFRWPILLTSE